MGKGSGASVLAVMLIGVILIGVIFGSQIIGFVSGLPDLFQDWIEQIRGTLPGAGGDVDGSTWIGYTVTYSDGTSKEIREDAPSFSLAPLSITFEGKEISSVTVHLKAKLTCSQGIGAWNANLSLHTEIYKGTESTPKDSATGTFVKTGASWVSGETKVLASYTVQASKLEQLVATYGDGVWHLYFTGSVGLTVNVDGVPVGLTNSEPRGAMDFVYANGVPTGLSVTGGCQHFSR